MKKMVSDLIDVISDIKSDVKLRNFSSLSSNIEKWQVLGDTMEAKLQDLKDINRFQEEIKKLRSEIKELEKKKKKAKKTT